MKVYVVRELESSEQKAYATLAVLKKHIMEDYNMSQLFVDTCENTFINHSHMLATIS
jgi:hypothetical protein